MQISSLAHNLSNDVKGLVSRVGTLVNVFSGNLVAFVFSNDEQAVFCSSLQCPDRSTPIVDASTTECGGGTCDASVCCEAKCSFHQCPDRTTPVVDADDIVCDDLTCTDDLCCEAKCSYFQCPSGETLVEDADDIVCPGLECSDGLCCEVRKSRIFTPVPFSSRARLKPSPCYA